MFPSWIPLCRAIIFSSGLIYLGNFYASDVAHLFTNTEGTFHAQVICEGKIASMVDPTPLGVSFVVYNPRCQLGEEPIAPIEVLNVRYQGLLRPVPHLYDRAWIRGDLMRQNRQGFIQSSFMDLASPHALVPHQKLYLKFEAYRSALLQTLRAHLPAQSFALWSAMVLGNKHFLSPALQKRFKHLGVYHLLVVSGFHLLVTFILFKFVSLVPITFFMRRWRSKRAFYRLELFPLLVTYGYVVLSNWSIPSMRAYAFLWVSYALRGFDVRPLVMRKLVITWLILRLINPVYVGSYSLLLSITAVLGITLFSQPLPFKPPLKKIYGWLGVAIGAYAFTLFPLALIATEFSVIAVLINFVGAPLFSIVIYLWILAGLWASLPFFPLVWAIALIQVSAKYLLDGSVFIDTTGQASAPMPSVWFAFLSAILIAIVGNRLLMVYRSYGSLRGQKNRVKI